MLNQATDSKYILLAEDNPADIQLVREALEHRKITHDLRVVQDGDRAVEFIERLDRDSTLDCPALLLLDLYLPKRDGECILRSLRASERCGQTPVVIMTSSGAAHDTETAARHAALHYFRKPATLEEFLTLGDVVKEIVARHTVACAIDTAS
ncbi:MAG TPA: response regulator [Bryobacteraceae bacterium]|jgi:CheY-like chemotaxis protein|nr:response regulator [Bryobacteraceae bacterium]